MGSVVATVLACPFIGQPGRNPEIGEEIVKLFSFWRSLATYRVRIALNLKGLAPEVIEVNLLKGHQRDPKFRAVNPMMAIPALVEGDGPVLFESLAIIEYLDETHPNPPLMPKEPKARARVRGLSQIVACDSHPLIVPRVREYLAHEFKVDEAGVMKWAQHWHQAALSGLEEHLSTEKETGTYCQGEQITMADICLASQVASANFFKVDLAPYPTVARIAATCAKNEAFARAHPLKQPGAPAPA
jgi:maleylacetoacetate isomerase